MEIESNIDFNHMDIEFNSEFILDPQLISMPPEIIDIIYKLTRNADMAKLSMTHTYIYDCRPVDAINYCKNITIHRKKFAPILNIIKTMEYRIDDKKAFDWGELGYESTRILNNCKIVYRHYDIGNFTVTNYGRDKFVMDKGRRIEKYHSEITVYMNTYSGVTHMLFLKMHAKYLYSDF